jgi:VanZ family protein
MDNTHHTITASHNVGSTLRLLVYAAVLECLQNFSPGRNPAVGDWLASSSGSLVGSTVAHLVGKVIKRPLFASKT